MQKGGYFLLLKSSIKSKTMNVRRKRGYDGTDKFKPS